MGDLGEKERRKRYPISLSDIFLYDVKQLFQFRERAIQQSGIHIKMVLQFIFCFSIEKKNALGIRKKVYREFLIFSQASIGQMENIIFAMRTVGIIFVDTIFLDYISPA